MLDEDLFGDIEIDPAPTRDGVFTPLGGVHREVIEAAASGDAHKDSTTALWGVPKHRKEKGWKSRLLAPVTLEEIRDRDVRAAVETTVSREVHGEWLVGSPGLRRADVVEVLKRQGYELDAEITTPFPFQRIEKWRRRER